MNVPQTAETYISSNKIAKVLNLQHNQVVQLIEESLSCANSTVSYEMSVNIIPLKATNQHTEKSYLLSPQGTGYFTTFCGGRTHELMQHVWEQTTEEEARHLGDLAYITLASEKTNLILGILFVGIVICGIFF